MTLYKVGRILSKGQEVRDQAPYWGKKVNDVIKELASKASQLGDWGGGKSLLGCLLNHILSCVLQESIPFLL